MPEACIEWHGRIGNHGYGLTPGGKRRSSLAHRHIYEHTIGTIPEGMEVDHLCRNRRCVNPAHLEAVTPAENRQRQWTTYTHCRHGHPRIPENLRWNRDPRKSAGGWWTCRVCWG